MMTPFLAQDAFSPPMAFAAWSGCAAFALLGWNQLTKAIREARGKEPHPANEILAAGGEELVRRVKNLEEEGKRIESEGKKDRKDLYSHVDETRRELKKDIGDLARNTEESMRVMPDRIITLLRNTGVIHDGRN